MAGALPAVDPPVLGLFTFSVISMFFLLYQDLTMDILHHPVTFSAAPSMNYTQVQRALPKLSVTAEHNTPIECGGRGTPATRT